jgi:hypothetical protein
MFRSYNRPSELYSSGSDRQYTNCTAHIVVVSYLLSIPLGPGPAAGLSAQHLSLRQQCKVDEHHAIDCFAVAEVPLTITLP